MEGDKRPAVFLDRDGVLIQERSYVCSVAEMCIFPFAEECITKIKKKGYYSIVITNQSGIARGLFSEYDLQKMNEYLIRKTGVDAIYYCPHHPNGIVEKYRKKCSCRKPQSGLLDRACVDFDIDMKRSYMAGDRASDILAGQRACIKTVLLESGYGTAHLEEPVTPDFIFNDLRDMIKIL